MVSRGEVSELSEWKQFKVSIEPLPNPLPQLTWASDYRIKTTRVFLIGILEVFSYYDAIDGESAEGCSMAVVSDLIQSHAVPARMSLALVLNSSLFIFIV